MSRPDWEKASQNAAWRREARLWVPYTPTITATRFGTNEIQTITVVATAGQFAVTFEGETTGYVSFNCTADQLLAAFVALDNVAEGDLAIVEAGGVYTITFTSDLARDVEELTVDTTYLTGTATVATTSPGQDPASDLLTLSTNSTHVADGRWRATGYKIEAQGEIRFGDDPADTSSGGWWLISLPEAPAAYPQHAGRLVFEQASSGERRTADGQIQPSTDGTALTGFVAILDGGSVKDGTNPATWGVPFTPARGDRILFWATFDPAELET